MRRILCWIMGHDWPWRELMDPKRVEELAKGSLQKLCDTMTGDFFCKRCGASWHRYREHL